MVRCRPGVRLDLARARALPAVLLAMALAGCGGGPSLAGHAGAGPSAVGSASAPSATTPTATASSATPGASGGAVSHTTSAPAPSTVATPPPAFATPTPGVRQLPAPTPPAAPSGAPSSPAAPSPQPGTWEIDVYDTPVESFHHGALQAITGCGPKAPDSCSRGTTPLGSYPADFLQAVQNNSDGRITSGPYTGDYLGWDDQDGWSIGTENLDDNGDPMRPFVTAGADGGIPAGTHFRVLSCGIDSIDGSAPDPGVCARLVAPDWVVGDGSGDPAGSHVVELYVGEENAPDFESTAQDIDDVDARTTLP